MKSQYKILLVSLVTFVLVLAVNTISIGGMQKYGHGDRFNFMEQLSDEQRDAVKAKIKELRETGASREEIRAEVKTMLTEYGIEIPENFDQFPGRGEPGPGHGFMHFSDRLSEDQKNTIKEKVEALHKQGASPEEIHTEVQKLLEEFGVEVPEHFNEFHGRKGPKQGRGYKKFSDQLNDEQRAALQEKVEQMREDGATRGEIHTEIGKMLKEYGIDVPNDFGRRIKNQ